MTDIIANIPDTQLERIGSKITEGVSRIIDKLNRSIQIAKELQASNG